MAVKRLNPGNGFLHWRAAPLVVLALALTLGSAAQTRPTDSAPASQSPANPSTGVLRQDWLVAPRRPGHWNRRPQFDALQSSGALKGKSRSEILVLLGQPGYSVVTYPYPYFRDKYLLSDEGDSLEIIYDENDSVSGYDPSTQCVCPDCLNTAPPITQEAIDRSGFLRKVWGAKFVTIGEAGQALGQPGDLNIVRTRMVWRWGWFYRSTWQIDGEPNHYLAADGIMPESATEGKKIDDFELHYFRTITYYPNCLPK
jgi:hypothetical protein